MIQRLQEFVDKNLSQYHVIRTNDVLCSIHGDVKVLPTAEATNHYTISSNPDTATVSLLS